MKRYEIICTPDQTRKALELGAPITIFSDTGNIPDDTAKKWHLCILGSKTYLIPTAEQMIGWLEDTFELGFHIWQGKGYYGFSLWKGDEEEIKYFHDFTSRKETTLAAIDAAFEYLSNNKK